MDIPRRIEQEQVEEDNSVEIIDLDQDDDTKSRLPPWLSRKALTLQLPQNRWRWRWATLFGIVFLTVLVIVLILGGDLSSWITSYLHIGFSPKSPITLSVASSFQNISTSSVFPTRMGWHVS